MTPAPSDETSSLPNTFNLKILLLLSFGHLVTDIYQGALPAILPFLKSKLSLSYTMAGVLLMAANFTSSILQPLFGHFSDKKEKAWLLPLGCLAAGLGLSLASLPDSYGYLLLLVVVSGLGVAAYHPEGYKTASFFTGERAATGMSVFSVGGNLGMALGPLFSLGVIAYLGFAGLPLMLVFSLLFLVLLSFQWGYLRSAQPLSTENQTPEASGLPGAYLALFLVIATVVMRSWIQLGLMTYIPFYFIEHLKGDPLYSGKLVTAFLLGGVAGTIFGSMLADRWGHKAYLVYSLLATSLLAPLILLATGPWLFVVLTLVCHGPAPPAPQIRSRVRAYGGVCHRRRRLWRYPPGRRGRSLRGAGGLKIHPGSPPHGSGSCPSDPLSLPGSGKEATCRPVRLRLIG